MIQKLVGGGETGTSLFIMLFYVPSYFIFLILKSGGGRKKEKERSIDWLPSIWASTGDPAYNPGTCPDQELNQQPFSLRDYTQPTEPPQRGLSVPSGFWTISLKSNSLSPSPPNLSSHSSSLSEKLLLTVFHVLIFLDILLCFQTYKYTLLT